MNQTHVEVTSVEYSIDWITLGVGVAGLVLLVAAAAGFVIWLRRER